VLFTSQISFAGLNRLTSKPANLTELRIFLVLLNPKIGDPVVIKINANQPSVRHNPHIRGSEDDLRFYGVCQRQHPTPVALAANAYRLSC
jgi:hypothetical protein